MNLTDTRLPNAVSFPRCARCHGPTMRRLHLPDLATGKHYDIFECTECGKQNWVEVPTNPAATSSYSP